MKPKKKRFEQTYPKHVVQGVKESLAEADKGKLILYKGIKDMLGLK